MNLFLPKISIITVVYNGGRLLDKTIQSVIEQTYSNIQYIIIDGGSSDGSVEIIKKYQDSISYWITEKDKGIYDAMNKGIEQAEGMFTLFLNAGDYLFNKRCIQDVITNYPVQLQNSDLIYGRSKIIKRNGALLDLRIGHSHEQLWKGPNFRHGSLLTRTAVLNEHRFELSEELKIAADFDFIYKCYHLNSKFCSVDTVVIAFLEEGVSENIYKHFHDNIYILKKYGDWNLKTKLHFGKKYLRAYLGKTLLKKVFIVKLAILEYLANHWINNIPFYFVRHLYYRYVIGITLEKNASIHLKTTLQGNNIAIGKNTVINRRCNLDGRGRLTIGANASISPDVHFITADHDLNSTNFSLRMQEINVEDYVWIGARATIIGNVTIGKGAVICACAVVTKDVAAWDVVAGIPAKKIKERRTDIEYDPTWMGWFD